MRKQKVEQSLTDNPEIQGTMDIRPRTKTNKEKKRNQKEKNYNTEKKKDYQHRPHKTGVNPGVRKG